MSIPNKLLNTPFSLCFRNLALFLVGCLLLETSAYGAVERSQNCLAPQTFFENVATDEIDEDEIGAIWDDLLAAGLNNIEDQKIENQKRQSFIPLNFLRMVAKSAWSDLGIVEALFVVFVMIALLLAPFYPIYYTKWNEEGLYIIKFGPFPLLISFIILGVIPVFLISWGSGFLDRFIGVNNTFLKFVQLLTTPFRFFIKLPSILKKLLSANRKFNKLGASKFFLKILQERNNELPNSIIFKNYLLELGSVKGYQKVYSLIALMTKHVDVIENRFEGLESLVQQTDLPKDKIIDDEYMEEKEESLAHEILFNLDFLTEFIRQSGKNRNDAFLFLKELIEALNGLKFNQNYEKVLKVEATTSFAISVVRKIGKRRSKKPYETLRKFINIEKTRVGSGNALLSNTEIFIFYLLNNSIRVNHDQIQETLEQVTIQKGFLNPNKALLGAA